jgi:hypothetical protein
VSSKNPFKKAFLGVNSAIKQGTARALNRALSSTKTKVTRALREETGLKTEYIQRRLRARKAKAAVLDIILGIAIKFDVALSRFSPKEKKVRVRPKGGKRTRVYQGATVKVGKGSRELVPGGFMLPNTEVVMQRQGEARYPTKQPKTGIFRDVAKGEERDAKAHMVDTFESIVAHEIEYAVGKQLKSNK